MNPLDIQSNPDQPSIWQTAKQRLKEPRVYVPVIFFILFLALSASFINRYYLAGRSGQELSPGEKKLGSFLKLSQEPTKQSPLDGQIYPKSLADRHALGIMVENHTASRPQSGLSSAAVVYEAIAEGGITRFLAIFGPKLPDKVGPVRSARSYYLDWCLEYDCFYAHVGGSADALAAIKKLTIKDLDQFRYGVKKYGRTFYRQPLQGVATEHTMHTDPARLYEIAKINNWPLTGSIPAISFKNDSNPGQRPASQQVSIEISSKQYNVVWDYDPTTNSYKRTMGGSAHLDSLTNQQLAAKVVIVQEIISQPLGEKTLQMKTVDTGKATIFQDGQRLDGSWEKTTQIAPTIFLDASGKKIRYNPGKRWITIVNPGSTVTVQ